MNRASTVKKRFTLALASTVALLMFSSCASFEESGLPGSASSMAHNQIMMVNAQPATFGHYRLTSLMRIHPDLDLFVAKRGMPDFLAETSNARQQYFILYYLQDREAYAARTRPPHRQRIEFAGPYPITEKEKQTLQDMRRNTSGNLTRRRSSMKFRSL